jgi:hypothetical protein
LAPAPVWRGRGQTDFYFGYRQISGDFTIVARMNSISPAGAGPSSRCGVMVRSALTANARHAFMAARPAGPSFVWRITDGANGSISTTSLTPALPRFVRLKRVGNALRRRIPPTVWFG